MKACTASQLRQSKFYNPAYAYFTIQNISGDTGRVKAARIQTDITAIIFSKTGTVGMTAPVLSYSPRLPRFARFPHRAADDPYEKECAPRTALIVYRRLLRSPGDLHAHMFFLFAVSYPSPPFTISAYAKVWAGLSACTLTNMNSFANEPSKNLPWGRLDATYSTTHPPVTGAASCASWLVV